MLAQLQSDRVQGKTEREKKEQDACTLAFYAAKLKLLVHGRKRTLIRHVPVDHESLAAATSLDPADS